MKAYEHFHEGHRLWIKEDYTGAIAALNKAVELEPEHGEFLHARGGVYLDSADMDSAITDFSAAIALKKDYPEALVNRAEAYKRKDKIEQALADCDEAARIAPHFERTYYVHGEILCAIQEYDRAIAVYTQAIAVYTQMVEAERAKQSTYPEQIFGYRYAALYTARGKAYKGKGDYENALIDVSHALEFEDYRDKRFLRGELYLNLKKYAEAIIDLTVCINEYDDYDDDGHVPEKDFLYYMRGGAYADLERYYDAIKDFDQAVEREPGNSRYHYARANSWYKKGLPAEALAGFNRARELYEADQDENEAARCQEMIQRVEAELREQRKN